MKRLLFSALLIPALLRGAEPLELARRVADKVVDNTRFELEYKLQSAYPDFGCVDFGRCMDRPGVAYALTTLRCEGDTEELFELGCTGPVRITIDDSVVYERPLPHPFAVEFDEKDYRLPESFRLRLTAGPHKLLVKTEYRGGEHLFLMQSRNFSRYAERGRKIFCTLETYAPKLKEARWLVLGTFEGDLATPRTTSASPSSAATPTGCCRFCSPHWRWKGCHRKNRRRTQSKINGTGCKSHIQPVPFHSSSHTPATGGYAPGRQRSANDHSSFTKRPSESKYTMRSSTPKSSARYPLSCGRKAQRKWFG